MKILIAGDNHCNYDIITQLNYEYEDFDLKLHTGDSSFTIDEIDNLDTWIKVRGNNDFLSEKVLPRYQIIPTPYGNILLTHGHYYNVNYDSNLETLQNIAKENNVKFIVYGHTHVVDIRKLNDFIIINPSSLSFPRSSKHKTYVEMYLDDNYCEIILKDVLGNEIEKFKF